jgi:hypothetical protein
MSSSNESSVSANLFDLLILDRQPESLRDCYELVEGFVASLIETIPMRTLDAIRALDPAEVGRLGYLLFVANHAGARMDESWMAVLAALEGPKRKQPIPADDPKTFTKPWDRKWTLLNCDPGVNTLDDISGFWGLNKGLEYAKIRQIVSTGHC